MVKPSFQWICPDCGAQVDERFELCWACGTGQDGVHDPDFVNTDVSDVPNVPDVSVVQTDGLKAFFKWISILMGLPFVLSVFLGERQMEIYLKLVFVKTGKGIRLL